MTPTNPPAHNTGPTGKQLAFLRNLAIRTGQTFAHPRTRAAASAEIRRLLAVEDTGITIAELEAERETRQRHDDTPFAVHSFEVTGRGASATWSQRS
jgi:hypothetical protein